MKPANAPIVSHSAARKRKRRGLNLAFGAVDEDSLCINMDIVRRQNVFAQFAG
jgi:hypothetical protein